MKAESQIYFKNRGIKRVYITLTLAIIGLFVLFYFVVDKNWNFPVAAIIPGVVMTLFLPVKYCISDKNTIEFYHLFGRKKRLSIPIENISEILVKPYRLNIDYKISEDAYPRSAVLELSAIDAKTIIDELVKLNPCIIIS